MTTQSTIRSSLPLEILLWIHGPLSIIFFLFFLGMYIYKLTYLNYPVHVEVCELIIIILFLPIEALRISWAHRGNLTETPTYISFSLLLGLGVIAICLYLGFFQGYVLLIERIVACIEGGFVILESMFGVVAVASFSRKTVQACTCTICRREIKVGTELKNHPVE